MIVVQHQPITAPPSLAPAFPTPRHSAPVSLARQAPPADVLGPLLRITQALSSEIESEKVYEAILGVVREVTGAQRVSLQLLSDYTMTDAEAGAGTAEEVSLVLVAGLGLPAAAQIGEARPVKQSVAAWVLKHRLPLLLNGGTHPDPEVRRVMRGSAPGVSALCVP